MSSSEAVITEVNPRVVRRLLTYLRPFKVATATAVIGLLFATVGEMLIPVVVQRSVDNYLLQRYVRVEQEAASRIPGVDDAGESVAIGSSRYIPDQLLDLLTEEEKARLDDEGLLDTTRYYVAPITDSNRQLVEEREDLFRSSESWTAVPEEELSRLSQEEITALRETDFAGVRRMTLYFFLVLLGILLFTFFQVYLMAHTGQGVMKNLRLELFDHNMRQSLNFLGTRPVGKLVSRITNDVETINELFTSVLPNLLRDLSMMVAVVVTMFALNSRLAAITLATLPPVFILTELFRRLAREAFRSVRRRVSRMNGFLSEYISGMSVVQTFVQEVPTKELFEEHNTNLTKAHLREMYVFAVFRPIIDLLSSISIAVVVYFGARLFSLEVVSLGVLIAFINLVRRFYQPVMQISEQFTILQSAMAGAERVFELLDTRERIDDSGSRGLPEPLEGRIRFEKVQFSYKPGEPVIRELSFSVEPGETVALVGYTGAGKTTIANLLTRLWDIQGGTITIDGVDVREFRLQELRRAVQPIQQDVQLFRATIRENITLGLDIPDEEVEAACRAVQAWEFIDRLPRGLDTDLQEGAANLSVGQRQLLAFARVIAHDPRILILDEATSSVDTETEQKIQAALERITEGRTSLVIAHRLSTIRRADRILVLSHGELVEAGPHQKLLDQDGVYATLYRLQYQNQPV
ncbi:MAG: ABC transporter ATP-binding protein [Alkalispirochaetaceae bacterium]